MQSYPLDLKTVIHTLSQKKQSGFLYAERVRLPGVEELMQANLTLVNGIIQSCYIRTKKGATYADGAQAAFVLTSVETTNWIWEESQVPSYPSQREVLPAHYENPKLIPRRMRTISNEEFTTLPRKIRHVWVLIDGGRSIEHIATLLSPKEQEELQTILQEMERSNMIAMQA